MYVCFVSNMAHMRGFAHLDAGNHKLKPLEIGVVATDSSQNFGAVLGCLGLSPPLDSEPPEYLG